MSLDIFPPADAIGLAAFLVAWLGYSLVLERGRLAARSLSAGIDRQRRQWIAMMQARDNRIADTAILGGLQAGTAFFASASMLAIGAALAVLGSADGITALLEDIAPAAVPTRALFEAKVIGLAVIFVYAFFKFGWSYRLFNYASILVGALPPASRAGTAEAEAAVERATTLIRLAGRNFNRGQRAFHFSLAYLGWLGGPWLLLAASLFVVAVLAHRQFWSVSARAVRD